MYAVSAVLPSMPMKCVMVQSPPLIFMASVRDPRNVTKKAHPFPGPTASYIQMKWRGLFIHSIFSLLLYHCGLLAIPRLELGLEAREGSSLSIYLILYRLKIVGR